MELNPPWRHMDRRGGDTRGRHVHGPCRLCGLHGLGEQLGDFTLPSRGRPTGAAGGAQRGRGRASRPQTQTHAVKQNPFATEAAVGAAAGAGAAWQSRQGQHGPGLYLSYHPPRRPKARAESACREQRLRARVLGHAAGRDHNRKAGVGLCSHVGLRAGVSSLASVGGAIGACPPGEGREAGALHRAQPHPPASPTGPEQARPRAASNTDGTQSGGTTTRRGGGGGGLVEHGM